jgi:branched-chain amino acid transport system substrate-binding protein
VIANLPTINNTYTALRGISGPLFFNDRGFVPQGLSLGQYIDGYFVSAPIQYRLVTDTGLYDLDEEIARGQAFELNGRTFRAYRVVYVGVEMIELRDLQIGQQSYNADFFIYFRYAGDDTPVNVVFTNANTEFTLGDPLQTSTDPDGLTYKLYRVQGDFSESMDFTDYPWDKHLLTIQLQNLTAEETDLIYVPDPAVLNSPQAQRQGSGFDLSRPFNQIQNWHIPSVDYAHVSITSTTDEYDERDLVHYSEFRVLLDLERDVRSFIIKNLLPLTLLTVVTYISLWLPPEEARTRVGFSITALLTAAVMLNTISSRLPDIGYTVAIEWGFYAYIGVVAVLGLLNVVVYRNYRAKRFARVRALDTFIRIFYPMVVLGTVTLYFVKFG